MVSAMKNPIAKINMLLGGLALAATVGFLTGCPDSDGGESCTNDCNGGVGWECPLPGTPNITYCANEATSQATCSAAGGGVVEKREPCNSGDGGNDAGSSDPVDPTGSIWIDPSSGQTIVDDAFIDDLFDGTLELDDETETFTEQTNGYYTISGISSGSVADALGLEDGDELRSINGIAVDEAGWLDAYDELKTASTITLRLIRSGRAVSIDYDIQ